MKKTELIVDLGSKFTTLYNVTEGTLKRGATLVAVKSFDKSVAEAVAVGDKVKSQKFKTSDGVQIIAPIKDGSVINVEVCACLIKSFLKEMKLNNSIFSSICVYVLIPCGLSLIERHDYEAVFIKAGFKEVILIEQILALSGEINMEGSLVAIINSGTTEIAVLGKSGIITGSSINLGGDACCIKIMDYLADNYSIVITEHTAEKIKNEIGNLMPNDCSSREFIGKDIIEMSQKVAEIKSDDIREPISYCYKRIAEVIMSTLSTAPQSKINEIKSRGLYLAGIGSALSGAQEYLRRITGLNIFVPKNPEISYILSAGKWIKDKSNLKKMLSFSD